ncbi:hypothetical protein FOA52_014878 [Chlamydomonas sp. UWO 241]|nr:hypothetical protein FOA52_014878 [Chlamydomonas sp. UWO 241]
MGCFLSRPVASETLKVDDDTLLKWDHNQRFVTRAGGHIDAGPTGGGIGADVRFEFGSAYADTAIPKVPRGGGERSLDMISGRAQVTVDKLTGGNVFTGVMVLKGVTMHIKKPLIHFVTDDARVWRATAEPNPAD